MSEKGPWGSPEVIRLDAQLKALEALRTELQKEVTDGSYEVIQGARFKPEITFVELPDELHFDVLKKGVETLATAADGLLRTNKIGKIAIDVDEIRKSIRVSIKDI